MERRSAERIPVNLDTRFMYGDMFYSGTVLNLSEKGMFINTMKYVPSNSRFVVVIKAENDILKILARVKRVTKKNSYLDGMGIEIIEPTEEYLNFFNKLKALN